MLYLQTHSNQNKIVLAGWVWFREIWFQIHVASNVKLTHFVDSSNFSFANQTLCMVAMGYST